MLDLWSTTLPKARNGRRTRLNIECLEARHCLSITTLGWDVSLYIVGDDYGSDMTLKYRAGLLTIKEYDYVAGMRFVTMENSYSEQGMGYGTGSFNANVYVYQQGGNDYLSVTLGTAMWRPLNPYVDMGEGNDSFRFDAMGQSIEANLTINVYGGSPVQRDYLNVAIGPVNNGNVYVGANLGAGNDYFYVEQKGALTNCGRVRIDLRGDMGNDEMYFRSTTDMYAAGQGILVSSNSILDVQMRGNLGNDIIKYDYFGSARGPVTLMGHGGEDSDSVIGTVGEKADWWSWYFSNNLTASVQGAFGDDNLRLRADGARGNFWLDGGIGWNTYGISGNVALYGVEQSYINYLLTSVNKYSSYLMG